MYQNKIDSLIERSGIRPGDSVWMKEVMFGLTNHYIIYLGMDDFRKAWFVGQRAEGVTILPEEDLLYLIQTTKSAKINQFSGTEQQRSEVTPRMLARLDIPTFNLILRNSRHFKSQVEESNAKFQWKEIAIGAGIGAAVLGATALALAAWKRWQENKDK